MVRFCSFHFGCWKVFKDDRKVKTEKEVLDLGCVTPDCRGIVNCVIVGKENGEKVRRQQSTNTLLFCIWPLLNVQPITN